MSNEITVRASLTINNVSLQQAFNPSPISINQASQIASGGVQNIGTATNAEFVALGDVTTAGWSYFRNLNTSTANWIDMGTGTGSTFVASIRLYGGGEIALLPLHPTNAIAARAFTSSTEANSLQYWVGSR